MEQFSNNSEPTLSILIEKSHNLHFQNSEDNKGMKTKKSSFEKEKIPANGAGGTRSRSANNGVSWYPSYQKIFKLAENFEQIFPTLSILQTFARAKMK